MAEEAQKENEAPDAKDAAPSPHETPPAAEEKRVARREISTIAFPYLSLEDAEEGAKAIHSKAGTATLTQPQAADAMGMSHASSGFRGRLAAMKLFGLMEYDQGRVQLTDLGRAIADPHTTLDARVEAFLRVPLYEKYAGEHDGHTIPSGPALEAEFIEEGVSKKQADRARQIFERSARYAGFLKPGSQRFVRPITAGRQAGVAKEEAPPRPETPRNDQRGAGGGADGGGVDLDPVVRALVQKIPPPGAPWGADEQVMWLRMMAMAFSMAYGGNRPIKIEVE